MTKFNGFKYEAPVAGRDWMLGAILGAPVNPSADWQPWLPTPEYQASNGYEPSSCISHTSFNAVETYVYKVYGIKMGRGWSDRFLAKASGTDPNSGNTYRNVLDTLRKLGAPLEDKWPSDGIVSLSDYYAPIPPVLYKDARTDFSDVWTVKYEEVPIASIETMLQYSPILISVTAWFEEDGIYTDKGIPNNHAVMCFKKVGDIYYVFDSYDNAIKKYRGLVQQAKRIWVGPAEEEKSILLAVFESLKKNGLLVYFATWWEKFQTPPSVEQPVIPTPMPPQPEKPKYEWDTPQKARHSVRVICDEEMLTVKDKNDLCATVGAESGWKPGAIGKPNFDGTRDYGICQINTKYWIGEGKQFPSIDYVLQNPEACIRWMCKQWKAGNKNWWIAYKNGSYKKYL